MDRICPTPSAILKCMNRTQLADKLTPPVQTLRVKDAARIKAAEYWLKLGEVDQAFAELGALPHQAMNHPTAVRVRVAAIGALRERMESVHA